MGVITVEKAPRGPTMLASPSWSPWYQITHPKIEPISPGKKYLLPKNRVFIRPRGFSLNFGRVSPPMSWSIPCFITGVHIPHKVAPASPSISHHMLSKIIFSIVNKKFLTRGCQVFKGVIFDFLPFLGYQLGFLRSLVSVIFFMSTWNVILMQYGRF